MKLKLLLGLNTSLMNTTQLETDWNDSNLSNLSIFMSGDILRVVEAKPLKFMAKKYLTEVLFHTLSRLNIEP